MVRRQRSASFNAMRKALLSNHLLVIHSKHAAPSNAVRSVPSNHLPHDALQTSRLLQYHAKGTILVESSAHHALQTSRLPSYAHAKGTVRVAGDTPSESQGGVRGCCRWRQAGIDVGAKGGGGAYTQVASAHGDSVQVCNDVQYCKSRVQLPSAATTITSCTVGPAIRMNARISRARM